MTTYATFRILGEDLEPEEVTAVLGITPSRSHRRGDPKSGADRYEATYGAKPSGHREGLWGLRSDELAGSDTNIHLTHLLDRLEPRATALAELKSRGYRMDCTVFWMNWKGHGGPGLDPGVMARLAALDLGVSWDVYEETEDD